MLILLSPSKSLNLETKIVSKTHSIPVFLKDSQILINELKKFSALDLAKLMKISDKLAKLNFERYAAFKTPFTIQNSKPAIFIFDGDVYDGIDVENYNEKDLNFAQNHLRILSGLYGILKPLDLIQPYRLEMGTNLKNLRGKNLYQFWIIKITDLLNEELENFAEKIILNLASEEYFSAVNSNQIKGQIINIIFKEKKGDDYKIIGIFAKKARGLMADYIIKNKIQKVEEVKKFNYSNYKFKKEFSDKNNWCFCR